jgi:hypothetical protein
MPLILPGNVASATAGGYEVANSCRFNAADDPYFSRTLGTATNRKKFTISVWVKLGSLVTGDNNEKTIFAAGSDYSGFHLDGNSDPALAFNIDNSDGFSLVTTQVLRDHSAWYHLVAAVDTTQGTEANRVKFYINGSQVSNFDTSNYPDQNYEPDINSGVEHRIGKHTTTSGTRQWDGYMAEFVFIDGTQYAASDFGEFNEDSPTIWQPKDVSGLTFGTNGAYLDFEDSGNLGDDHSTNTNDWAENNLAATDQSSDSPTNNFATGNPLAAQGGSAQSDSLLTFSEGNLIMSANSETGIANIGVSAGKWYWEVKVLTDQDGLMIGACNEHFNISAELCYESPASATGAKAFGYYGGNGNSMIVVGDGTSQSYGSAISVNDIIGVALDVDSADQTCTFYLNGSSQGSLDITNLGSGESYFPAVGNWSVADISTSWNFGNPTYANTSSAADAKGYGDFEYAPPAGFLALCTKNLGSTGG